MTEEMKMVLGIQQIDNMIALIEGNEYQQFLYSHLVSVQVELQRQLTNLCQTDNIKE